MLQFLAWMGLVDALDEEVEEERERERRAQEAEDEYYFTSEEDPQAEDQGLPDEDY